MERKNTWDSKSCQGLQEILPTTIFRAGHCATRISQPHSGSSFSPHTSLRRESRNGWNPLPLQPIFSPYPCRLNHSASHTFIWDSYFSCMIMQSCIIFSVIPTKTALYYMANIGVLVTLVCIFHNSLLELFRGSLILNINNKIFMQKQISASGLICPVFKILFLH